MKKVIPLLILALFLLGCGTQEADYNVDESNYRVGSQGLEMDFLDNAPPYTVYDGDNIQIMVELENLGAYPEDDIFEGKLEISGFDPNSIKGTWDAGNDIPITLRGKSRDYPDGGYEIMTFSDHSGVSVPFGGPEYEANILITACYKYKTLADPIVCIDPEPYEVVQETKVCHFDDAINTGGSQGAPVAITRVEERVSNDHIIFNIYLTNVGDGRVVDWAAYEDCPFDLEIEDVNRVRVHAQLPFDSNPDCSPSGSGSEPLILREGGTGFITCRFRKPDSDSAFKAPLHIEVDYVYTSSIDQRVEIIKV